MGYLTLVHTLSAALRAQSNLRLGLDVALVLTLERHKLGLALVKHFVPGYLNSPLFIKKHIRYISTTAMGNLMADSDSISQRFS